jgi:hypothetical protein
MSRVRDFVCGLALGASLVSILQVGCQVCYDGDISAQVQSLSYAVRGLKRAVAREEPSTSGLLEYGLIKFEEDLEFVQQGLVVRPLLREEIEADAQDLERAIEELNQAIDAELEKEQNPPGSPEGKGSSSQESIKKPYKAAGERTV